MRPGGEYIETAFVVGRGWWHGQVCCIEQGTVKARRAFLVERDVYPATAQAIDLEGDRISASGEAWSGQQQGCKARVDTALCQHLLVERSLQRSVIEIFGIGVGPHHYIAQQQHHAGTKSRQMREFADRPNRRHGFAITVFQYGAHEVHLGFACVLTYSATASGLHVATENRPSPYNIGASYSLHGAIGGLSFRGRAARHRGALQSHRRSRDEFEPGWQPLSGLKR
ncbi:hypothetical protein D3C87_1188600 [compost metagenome]